jgi:hypothetical protein
MFSISYYAEAQQPSEIAECGPDKAVRRHVEQRISSSKT